MNPGIEFGADNVSDVSAPMICNVLIVEDDPHLGLALRRLLEAANLNIVVAATGEEALHLSLTTDFAVILMDVKLPGMDGFATARRIRAGEGERHAPIIFMTGADQDAASSVRGYQAGAVDYLYKPVVPTLLRSKLSVFVDLYRYNAALIRETAERKAIEEELRTAEDRLRAFAANIEAAREDERTRVSREVHDDLGQALTGLKMDLSWLEKRLTGKSEETAGKMKAMLGTVDTSIQSVRRISSALRPQVLDDVGLIDALRWQASEFQVRTGIRCKLNFPAQEPALDRAQSTAAFRTLQEALANVARHAGATRVDISLSAQDGQLILKIADNGRGASKAELLNPKALGLLASRERATVLGGKVDIEGKRGKGTTVTLSVPY